MECTAALVGYFPHAAESSLERLLPQLLLRVQEPREATRTAAQTALEAIQEAYPPELLLHVLLRVLDVPTPRVRIGALGLIASSSAGARVYLSAAQHMRPCVQVDTLPSTPHPLLPRLLTPPSLREQKTLPLFSLSDKNAELKNAALATLRALHAAGGPTFVQQLALLPMPTQNALRGAMRDSALDADLAVINRPARAQSARPPTNEAPFFQPPPPSHPHPEEVAYAIRAEHGRAESSDGTPRRKEHGAPAASGANAANRRAALGGLERTS